MLAEAEKGAAEAGKGAAVAEKGVAEAIPLGEVVSPQCGDEAPSYPESTEVLIKRLLVFRFKKRLSFIGKLILNTSIC
jgi:hypothetical protein